MFTTDFSISFELMCKNTICIAKIWSFLSPIMDFIVLSFKTLEHCS